MNDAEILIMIADEILKPHDRLVGVVDGPEHTIAVATLALRLRRNPGVALRALMEEWDRQRIVRELY